MSWIHGILGGWLTAVGRHQDAAEVAEAAAPPPPRKETPPEPILEAGEVETGHRAIVVGDTMHQMQSVGAGGGSAEAGTGGAGGSSSSSAAEAGGAGAGGAGDQRGADANGASGSSREGGSEKEKEKADPEKVKEHGQEHGADQHQQPDQHADQTGQRPDFGDDPLAGVHSDRMRDKIERDAFKSASADAQDSAVWRNARETMPPELLRHLDRNAPAARPFTPEERTVAIQNLRGAIPDWAKGDPQNDPALLRAAEPQTRAAEAQPSAVRESSQTPAPTPARIPSVDHGRER